MESEVRVCGVVVKEGLSGYRFYADVLGQLQEGIKEYVTAALNRVLDEEVERLLGRRPYVRRDERNQQRVTARCLGCGSRRQQDFLRDGHKPRGLVTLWASLTVLMPRLRCCRCGGTVSVAYETIKPRQRVWDDIGEETRVAWGLGQGLHEIKGRLDLHLHTSFGLRMLNERVREMSKLVAGWQEGDLTSPPVLLLDAFWIRVMKPNGRVRRDKEGRKRQRKGLFWLPVMVALGLWPEEREKHILDWEIGNGPGEDARSRLKLLTRLEARGIRGDQGLRLIIHDGSAVLEEALEEVHFAALRQRCLFHKLRNVLEAIRFPDELQQEEK